MRVRIGGQEKVTECTCGSRLDHWQKYSGERLPMFCYAMACPGTPAVGAAVRMGDAEEGPWYIVPLCIEHGAQDGSAIELIPGTPLVRADATRTCDKGARF